MGIRHIVSLILLLGALLASLEYLPPAADRGLILFGLAWLAISGFEAIDLSVLVMTKGEDGYEPDRTAVVNADWETKG